MSLTPLAAAACSALALTGCAAMNVSAHVDRAFDFARPHTYSWAQADALPVGDPRLENNPFFHDEIRGAIEKGLASRRYVLTEHSPDLLLHYHANVRREIDVTAIEREYSNCSGRGCYPSVIEYEAGTLLIDMVDARTGTLVWRAWAQGDIGGVIDNQDRLRAEIHKAVDRMLARLPPTL